MDNNIEPKDLEILDILKKDSRTPIREISLKTGIKQSTVHQRIGRLLKKKIIESFTIKTNDELMGENTIIFLHIATSSPAIKELKKNRQVKEIHEITGEYNYLLKIKAEGIKEYNALLNRIKKDLSTTKIFSTIVTDKIKEE